MQNSLAIGDITVSWLNGGEFELDGGAMFGVVPKALWMKRYPGSAENLVRLGAYPLLIRTATELILIDSGIGNKLTEKQHKIFRVHRKWDVPAELQAHGFTREDVTKVILTHCDFDHAGGVVMHDEQDRPQLTFPNASHLVQEKEWHDVMHPNRRSANTYWRQNFSELIKSDQLQPVDGSLVVTGGIRIEPTGGHTRGHQIIIMESQGQMAIHMGDLLPTHAHFNPLWVMAYDNFPLEAIEQKEALEQMALRQNSWFTFYHDIYYHACRFSAQGEVTEKMEICPDSKSIR